MSVSVNTKNTVLSEILDVRNHVGTYLGVEVELEHVVHSVPEDDDGNCEWDTLSNNLVQCIEDRSLRNYGAEFVFRKPLMYGSPEFDAALKYIQHVGTDVRAESSHRTSTHVHLNVSDCTAEQFQNVLYLSLLIEPVLMEYCSEYRQNNRFCVPSYKAGTRLFSNCIRGAMNRDRYEVQDSTYGVSKYAAISLHRLSDLGTIEFRMFDGTYDAAKIQAIGRVLHFIRRVSLRRSLSDLKDAKVQGRLLDILCSVVRRSFGTKVQTSDIKSLLDKGGTQANDAVHQAKSNSVDYFKLLGDLNDFCNKLEQREVSESTERAPESTERETTATTVDSETTGSGVYRRELRLFARSIPSGVEGQPAEHEPIRRERQENIRRGDEPARPILWPSLDDFINANPDLARARRDAESLSEESSPSERREGTDDSQQF